MSSSMMDLGLDEDEPLSIPLRRPLQNSSAPRDKEPLSDDLEKLQQWHEERMQRRLRGEYESAVQHLAELVNESTERSGRLISVRVEGARRTRGSFLDALFAPYLFPSSSHGIYPFSAYNRNFIPQPAENIGDILRTGRHLTAQMLKTDLFTSVQARLEASRDVFAQEGDLDLVLRAPERGWLMAKTTTEVGNGEGSAGMTVRLRNIFGGAETLEGNVSAGTKSRRAFQGTLSAPLLWMDPSLRTYGALAVSGVKRDNSSFCSASEDIHTIRASIKTEALGRGIHEVAYNAAYRMIGDLTPSASISMRLAAGPSLKSSLVHTWTLDTQDNKIAGTSGAVTKLSQELAGLGGDAAFYKAEGEYTISRRVPGTTGMTWSFGAKAGAMTPLYGKSTLFPDRFQLGGPSNVRLFRSNSLGPHDGVDSLGGDMYWAAGLSLVSDIPKKAHWPIKTHLFLNAGRLDNRNTSKSLSENIASLVSQPSISAGVGLVYKFDWVRVEANFGVPLASATSDGARKGFQVGMGIDFL